MNPGWSHLKFLNLITSAKMLFLNKVTFTGSVGSEYGHTFCRGPSRNSLQDDTESFLLWVVGGWETRLHTPVILLFFFF